MYTTYIGKSGHTNETITLLKDGRLFTQGFTSSNRGITWEKSIGYISTDGGYTWSEENIGRAIPHSNIRLHDGRLMAAFRDPQPENVIAAGLNGTTYSIGYSYDDGLTWPEMNPLTDDPGCFM